MDNEFKIIAFGFGRFAIGFGVSIAWRFWYDTLEDGATIKCITGINIIEDEEVHHLQFIFLAFMVNFTWHKKSYRVNRL